MRSTLIKAAVVLTTIGAFAGTAQADPAAGVVPAATDVVGVGSDTTQGLLNTLTDHYNTKTPAPANKAYSWDATNSAGTTITPKAGAPTINRPNGSSAGISALIADGTAHNLDFARSSRKAKTDGSEANYGFLEFARDTVTFATAETTNVPATLTTLDLNTLYGSAAGSAECNRTAYLPQAGSGTRAFFLESIGLTAPGTCALDTFNGNPVQEHNAEPLVGNANAIAPFSVGRAVGLSGIKVNTVDDSVRPAGKAPAETARVNPADGQAVTEGGVVAYDRALFNVIRKSDKTVAKFSGLFGSLGYICTNATARADIIAAGFRRSTNCGVDRN